ncbi:aminotransferase class I/II-fold pyridoxal phosphate-dependent enzyme [Niabella sp.]|uniref:pyridoxal phosphate-dependent aminotransferase n=1 Tax=Niabella sp. TaxID=1962976 RepID=UPI00260CEFB7|nr:aminotransferase class I/II-fold pyridoxal phosphate-dependent enzyme [Niabella sp.]
MEIAKRLQGVGEYYFSKKLREIDELNKQGKNIINLGIGSPDLPPHPEVVKTLQEEAQKPNVHGYQNYKGSPVLREAFAGWYRRWYGVALDPETEVLPLIGSKEGIMHICMTYLNEGDAALVPNPGYPTYRSNVTIAGGVCIDYELKEANGYQPDLEAIEAGDLSRVKLMFVNYPQMPTGQQPDMEVLKNLVAFAKRHGILLVHDNPYSFILNEHPASILSIEGAKEVAVELNSLSKSHNMAGWRVGVLCGAAARIDEVLRFKSNMDSGMFLPVQLAAATALSLGNDWHEEVNAIYSARRKKVYDLLDLLGCRYSKEQVGLFVWAAIPDGYKDGYELADAVLYNAHVFITPGGIFGNAGDRYIRISLCGSVQRFDEAITRVNEQITKIRS